MPARHGDPQAAALRRQTSYVRSGPLPPEFMPRRPVGYRRAAEAGDKADRAGAGSLYLTLAAGVRPRHARRPRDGCVSPRGAYILRHIDCSPRTRKTSGMASRHCITHRLVCCCGSDMVAWPDADRVFGSYSRHGRRGDAVALMVCGRCFSLAVAKISVGPLTVAEFRAAPRGAVP